jgi:acyl-homoserine lactone acylase PvdQ
LAAAAPADDALALNSPYGPVSIARDAVGVPSIRARGENGAQFGLGYAHAQDRLWQMEFQRRLASGRTSEFLGPDGLKFDRLFRAVGLRRVAEAPGKLGARDRAALEAYAAGVNVYLASLPSQQLPPEFGLLAVRPEPWTPVDVLAFGRLLRGATARTGTRSCCAAAEQTGIGADGRGSNAWHRAASQIRMPLWNSNLTSEEARPRALVIASSRMCGRTVRGRVRRG